MATPLKPMVPEKERRCLLKMKDSFIADIHTFDFSIDGE
jgi:hypothetical protein